VGIYRKAGGGRQPMGDDHADRGLEPSDAEDRTADADGDARVRIRRRREGAMGGTGFRLSDFSRATFGEVEDRSRDLFLRGHLSVLFLLL
jgi:hypothetical protein